MRLANELVSGEQETSVTNLPFYSSSIFLSLSIFHKAIFSLLIARTMTDSLKKHTSSTKESFVEDEKVLFDVKNSSLYSFSWYKKAFPSSRPIMRKELSELKANEVNLCPFKALMLLLIGLRDWAWRIMRFWGVSIAKNYWLGE